MFHPYMQKMGEERSAIRELFEYGKKRKAEIGEENVFDFSIGNPSAPPPPAAIGEILRLAPDPAVHGYTSAAGDPAVRKAVSDYIQTTFGVPMSEDLVYMTCGASASLAIFFRALLQAGEEVIVPAPYFPEYAVFIGGAGGKLVAVPTDRRFHLDPEAVGRAITPRTRAVLVNSPNNPSGAVYTKGEMAALGDLLRAESGRRGSPIYLVADEPYREICFTDPPVYPMAVYENTAVLYSFSKSLSLAGERIGYIALSPSCAHAEALFSAVCGAGRSLGYVCAPSLFQKAVAGCLGVCSDLSLYRDNRDLLYGSLSDMGYTCAVPEGAFYLFVQALEADAKAFSLRARGYELLLTPSDSFGVEGYCRISYCVPKKQILSSLPAFRALRRSYR